MQIHTVSFFTTILIFLTIPLLPAQSDDFEIVKDRVVAELMKSEVDDDHIRSILDRMKEDGSYDEIDYEDLSRTAGFPHRHHTYDLVHLAKAYKNPSSKFFEDQDLKERITTSLNYWVDHDFFGDNWHNNQISTPTNLVNLMLVMGDEFPDELVKGTQPIIGRAHMNASGARPSGDRIVIAGILAKNLLFVGDKKQFEDIIKLIEGEVKFSTGERGMQHDFSFHHRVDRVNNTTSYGYGKYANAFGEWSYYVANTKYAFSVEKINHLVDYYLDGIYKQMVYGIYTDISVKNRSISHKATFEPHSALEIERLLFSTDYRSEELEEIMRLRRGEGKPSQSFAKFFWQTEHFVFQRPEYYTSVRMYSTRNRNMEVPYNGPGKLTHHRADGTNYLMLTGDEYHNIWPVYDWQKISGTTIAQKPELPGPDEIQLDGLTDFVGAVTDGMYGAVAFDFRSPHDFTTARKSWFFFDEEYVCLGTDIKCSERLPVVTTVDQTLMRSDVTIQQKNKAAVLPEGSHELTDVNWVFHDQRGYILPKSTTVHLDNKPREGRWSDITDQKNISDSLISEEVFTLYFDHGSRPDSASYEYIVVPATTLKELSETASNHRGITVLSNTSRIQAVESVKQAMCQMAFYGAGEVKTTEGLMVELESQGMVMLKMKDSRVEELSVADPSRKLSKIMLTLSGKYEGSGDDFTVNRNGDESTLIIINLPQGVYAGKSVTVGLE